MLLSRRTFLQGAAALAGTAALGHTGIGSTAEPFAALRKRWSDLLLGSGIDAKAEPFQSRLAGLAKEAIELERSLTINARSLWPDVSLVRSAGLNASYSRLRTMTLAAAQHVQGVDPTKLVEGVLAGLRYLHDRFYNAAANPFDNWYHFQIGIPKSLLDILVLLRGQISAEDTAKYVRAIEHFGPPYPPLGLGRSTGANRVDRCQVLALIGAVNDDSHWLDIARGGLSAVFPYVTTGDGFYPDGSFLQHGFVPYQSGYGAVLLRGFADLLYLLVGSPWQVTDPQRRNIFDAVTRSYAPCVFNGLCMDAFNGRGISRPRADDHQRGHQIAVGILRLSHAAPDDAASWRAMVKGWMQRESFHRLLDDEVLGLPEFALCTAVLNDKSVSPSPETAGHTLFYRSDRAIHRRQRWAAAISMCSERIAYYESGNGENLRGWHTGAGMLYWWPADNDNGQYSDAFWPTVDPYRLPGTTVSRKPLADGEGGDFRNLRPSASWVGGATDGEFATIGQDLRGFHSTLLARKSWFCLDDAIVCLGAGITCNDGTAVETTIENRNLGASGSPPLIIDGQEQVARAGTRGPLPAAWCAIEGYGAYLFPSGGRLQALRETRTGSWHDINSTAPIEPISRNYLTLWFDHGSNPVDASYAYVLLPGATPTAAARRAQSKWLTILANSHDMQVVSAPSIGVLAANFWSAGSIEEVAADAPCAVLIREQRGAVTIVMSDPSRTATSADATVQVAAGKNGTEVKVTTAGSFGKSHQCELA